MKNIVEEFVNCLVNLHANPGLRSKLKAGIAR
jgi:hypothetical protein